MNNLRNTPIIGASRTSFQCKKTIRIIMNKIKKISDLEGKRLLDVGCGDGSFTIELSSNFKEVHAIDVQQDYINSFSQKIRNQNKYILHTMSACEMNFPKEYFDTVISIETIEHVSDLTSAVSELYRVLRRGGELIITCPNRLFPFETHGIMIWRKRIQTRIPLITWIPFLHNKFSLARAFTVRRLDKMFNQLGFQRVAKDYIWPTFEHGGNPFQLLFKPLFGLMRFGETSWIRFLGSSIIVKYIKQ